MSARRSRRRRTGAGAGWALAILLIAAGGAFTVTVALDSLTGGAPLRPVCMIDDDGGQVRLSPEKMANAALITGVGIDRDVGERAIVIALATAMQESSLRNLDHGDRDSLGLFQQRPSQGWGSPEQVQDPVYSTTIFYDRLLDLPDFEHMDLTDAAQAVQISAFPNAYAKHEHLAQVLHDSLTGAPAPSLTCRLGPSEGLAVHEVATLLSMAHPEATVTGLGTGVTLGGGIDPWVLAHWAVATAEHTGVSTVGVEAWQWSRDQGWKGSDHPVTGVVLR